MPREKGGFVNNTIRTIGEGIGGAIKGAVKGANDYVVGKTPGGQTTVDMPPVSLFTGLAGAARGAYLGAQGKYAAPKGSADYQGPRSKAASAPTDKANNPNRVTGSGPSMGRTLPNYGSGAPKPKQGPSNRPGRPLPMPVPMPNVTPENKYPGAKPVPMPNLTPKNNFGGAKPVPMPNVMPDTGKFGK
jgi:hypothetical protein